MKQLAQKLLNGKLEVIDVPCPVVSKGMVLIQNAFSVVSAGTEGSTVKAARRSLIGKAKERPQQAKQMFELLMQAGPIQAYRTLMKKLDSYSFLGYSSAGYVIGIGEGVSGFSIGDKVACGGSGASHSEIIIVPQNLCVRLAGDADLKKAAYNTLGAIAIQGIRQADLKLGECCAVIGLGLLGHLTCLILKASGNKVIGIDLDQWTVNLAQKYSADIAFIRSEPGLVGKKEEFTKGIGVDAVIITAATKSDDPINFAGKIIKKKGRIVIVGDIGTRFEREPYFYKKELEIRMSCSYGPGRYDPNYEEKGIDYPPAYVRWTERRNMELFQELIHSNKIDIDYLTTHIFKLNEAPKIYDLITEKKEPYLGIIIKYEENQNFSKKISIKEERSFNKLDKVGIAFIGAGSYAMSHLLPNIPKERWISRKGIMTSSGLNSRSVAERFGFEFCTTEEEMILQDNSINTVFIVTRHNTHAEYVIKSLISRKNIFVEKPLCLNEEELNEINNQYQSLIDNNFNIRLMIGFNRRFSPLTEFIKEKIGSGPMSMVYRINAGNIPPDSWIQDKEIGGGRIIGEICHFVDLLTFFNGSLPERIQAFCMPDVNDLQDTVIINIKFENGSIGTLSYFSNGPKNLPKEYIEIYNGGCCAIIKDFKEAEFFSGCNKIRKKIFFQDKGQSAMVRKFLYSIKNGENSPISFNEIYKVTLSSFKILESLKTGLVVKI